MSEKKLRKPYQLARRPGQQGLRPQLSNWGWVEKSDTERTNLKPATDTLHVGTWNVCTLYAAGKHELLKIEMSRYKCDILGIS